MSETGRVRLAQAQAELVNALVGKGAIPAGFDADRIALASRSLLNKRVRETARAWPALARCLGERYAERFREYGRITPPPAEGGPLADGYAFSQTIPLADLDADARKERFLIELHWQPTREGLRPRRGCALRWLRVQGRLFIGVRIPGLGVRVVSF